MSDKNSTRGAASLVRRAGRMVATGVVGVVAVDAARSAARRGSVRNGAVTATAWALRGRRRMETGAEKARLAGGDIVAEARARVGEQAPPPGQDIGAHAHDHDH